MLRIATVALVVVCFILAAPREAQTFSSGGPTAHTGAPGEQLCTRCHGSFDLNSGTGSVSIEAPEGFVAGGAVTISIAVDNTTPASPQQKSGFQVAVKDDTGADVGSFELIDPTLTRFAAGGETHVTHTSTGSSTATAWQVRWIAPDPAPATVTVYAVGNAANGNGSPGGDFIYTTSTVLEQSNVGTEQNLPDALALDAVWPNPTRDRATLAFALAQPAEVHVALVDGLGRRVAESFRGRMSAGPQTVVLDAAGLAPGVYFAQVTTPTGQRVLPLTVAR